MTKSEMKKLAIEHWRRMRNAETPSDVDERPTAPDCPFCVAFLDEGCKGCPVAQAAGFNFCEGTPYPRAIQAWNAWQIHTQIFKSEPGTILKLRDEWRAKADLEIAFLESLVVED
jgi:hypothetical protein